jgi:ppGpp synthetase/RelA/SpoT-type nucleotidyltranferase/Flp pilus assembly protein TadD
VNTLEAIAQTYSAHAESWRRYLNDLGLEIETFLRRHHLHADVKQRVKTFESLSEKRGFLSRAGSGEPEIKDLLGLRVVVPFQEEVEAAVTLLREHFGASDIERKSDKLSFREFAYDAVHVELPLREALVLPPGCRTVVEVQVRTILQDAWAEVEHQLIYKNHFRFPNNDSIRKKLAAVNASLTLADIIFQEIRDSQKALAQWGQQRFQAMLDQSSAEVAQDLDWLQEELSQQATPSGGEPPLPGTREEIERQLMAALKAHSDKDYATAAKHYSQVLALNPEIAVRSIVFNHRGMANFMLGRETRALSDFDRAYQCDKHNYRALNNRAMVLRRLGYVDEALECFGRSLEIAPNQSSVYFLRAQTLAEIDQLDEARADLGRALALEPGHKEALALLQKLEKPAKTDA